MLPTIIRCTLIRAGGTRENIDGINYHFQPDELGNHIATVTEPAHIKRFLSITEAYEFFGQASAETAIGATLAAPVVEVAAAPVVELKEPAPLQTTPNAQAGMPENMAEDELRDMFINVIGREPGPRSKPETMLAQIRAKLDERAAEGN